MGAKGAQNGKAINMIDLNTRNMMKKESGNVVYVSAILHENGALLLNSRGQKRVN